MSTQSISKSDRNVRIDSVNDQEDQATDVLPLTVDQLSWVGGGEGQVVIG
jgi:hypothetical protein